MIESDKFEAFFQAREEALLTRIKQVMRKPIARETSASIMEDVLPGYQEDEDDEP